MIESVKQQYDQMLGAISGQTGIGEPNERNAGIAPVESAIAFVAAIGASCLARELPQATWRTTLDRDPPKNPASREVEWKEAMLWGAASGALVGLARIASQRVSSDAYRNLRS